ncbi:MAG: alpha-hydroxy-acid oxidizing protein [Eubacterium sp.]|jgi:NAD(P)H-dependent flavin oxidoreductase YrpB (nitropropane dioxygenase family)|nr:alpha-hydroxy-acid oxidizing protein [Eubacterium sp.]MCH4047702.1 alpha-hydroxy-acid oxidizing protein [Eubacterium sp.]MCH4078474.1 alpha-hydroxy-acid oxidizing protein [Eubacterium sp.]MCH4109618.1 alpha-hydroxy-acid oxidizing protein [Eubacterium sp.]MCI1306714.1 alpha-hydroxy-acid oxidizing protein [Eubacterium sp.]
MTYDELLASARESIGDKCKACPVCDGKACRNKVPGPGAKGLGLTAIGNFDAWRNIKVNMDTLCANADIDTSLELFGKKFKFPIFAGPVGAVNLHYGPKYNDVSYNDVLVSACAEEGIAAFTGDGTDANVMKAATKAIKAQKGLGVPTVKPWNMPVVKEKMALVKESGAFACAMDVDAAGLPFLKGLEPPAGRKSVEELHEIVEEAGVPFIVKGVMTPNAAMKALAAGASGIVVSNHGGRVQDDTVPTAEVLEEIADAVSGQMKIFVDGGIRTGADVFKALAMGADAVLIARPYVTAVYGGGAEGVKFYTEKIGNELADTMMMCGANTLDDITRDMIYYL